MNQRAVRRVFRKRRAAAIASGNAQVKARCAARGPAPPKGPVATRRFARGAGLVSRPLPWRRHAHGPALRVGLQPARQAACGLMN